MPDNNSQKKWYENWIQVFKSGTHTDSAGNTRTWTNDDLDQMVANYNTKEQEAPIVFGHPKTDDPAFGWVKAVRRNGDTLEIMPHNLLPEFIDAVNKGMYRKISVALTGDNNLRHVGFLGAVPPAVKGLQHAFGEDEQEFTTFNQELNNSFTQQTEEKTVKERFQEFLAMFNQNQKDVNEFKEAVAEEIKPQLKEELQSEFQEKIDAAQKEAVDAKTELAKLQKAQKSAEHKEFAEGLVKSAKIKADQVGLVSEFCSILSEAGEFEFSEGAEKESALDKFKEFMGALPKQTELGSEFATGDKLDPDAQKDPEFAAGEDIAKSLEA